MTGETAPRFSFRVEAHREAAGRLALSTVIAQIYDREKAVRMERLTVRTLLHEQREESQRGRMHQDCDRV